MAKEINTNLYTFSRLVEDDDGSVYFEELEDDCLFADMETDTDITEEDLPEWFVRCIYYDNAGFISAKGVKDIVYKVDYEHDLDAMYVSYDLPITEENGEYSGWDYEIDGHKVVDFILAAKKYSGIDTDEIENMVIEKREWYVENFPEDYGSEENAQEYIMSLKKLFNK